MGSGVVSTFNSCNQILELHSQLNVPLGHVATRGSGQQGQQTSRLMKDVFTKVHYNTSY